MKTIETILKTTAVYNDDHTKKYLLTKEWDITKPSLTMVLLSPSTSSGIEIDTTTQRVLGNADRLGFGSVNIVNLFATMSDPTFSTAEEEDKENMKVILDMAKKCDTLVYAPGNGKARNEMFQMRSVKVLNALKPYEKKMKCLSNEDGSVRLCHPLFPAVRVWYLRDTTVTEAMQSIVEAQEAPKSVGRPKKTIK